VPLGPSTCGGVRNLGQAGEGSLCGPIANAYLSADRAPGTPLGAEAGYLMRIHGNPGPSDLAAIRSGIPEASTHSLANQAALKLRDGGEDRK